ncbi:ClpP/crotonase-like domain-containing protein [Flagelloscypha sp. PMI_526]|nr:ClpP/crotonase-like domain-containing protein [Flagelloscypha sp. PMI_526]
MLVLRTVSSAPLKRATMITTSPKMYGYLSATLRSLVTTAAPPTPPSTPPPQSPIASDPPLITLESHPLHPRIKTLSLNRPKARNAISVQLLRELAGAVRSVSEDASASVLIVASAAPEIFCAGADLRERKTMSEKQVWSFLDELNRTLTSIETLPIPTIAAIDGPALGGGLELALSCDFRVGIIPGAGGTQRLPRLIGLTRAKELIFTGRNLTAKEALETGLVDHVGEEGAYWKAIDLAVEMCQAAPLSLRASKASVSQALTFESIEDGLNHERRCYEPLFKSKDREEALKAFAEKRTPVWTGE